MAERIRPVTPQDAAAWLRLRNQLWEGDDHAAEIAVYFAGRLSEPQEVLLAEDGDGRIVAHMELSIRDDVAGLLGIETGYIEGLYVEPANRRQGLTRALLRAAERWAQRQGCAALASDRDERVVVYRRFKPSA